MFESDLMEWEHLHCGVCVCFYDRSAEKITVDEMKFPWSLLVIDSQLGDKWWKKTPLEFNEGNGGLLFKLKF